MQSRQAGGQFGTTLSCCSFHLLPLASLCRRCHTTLNLYTLACVPELPLPCSSSVFSSVARCSLPPRFPVHFLLALFGSFCRAVTSLTAPFTTTPPEKLRDLWGGKGSKRHACVIALEMSGASATETKQELEVPMNRKESDARKKCQQAHDVEATIGRAHR